MINIAALVQLKAFARQDGVFLALWWTASFLMTLLVPTSSIGGLLAMTSPFFVGWLLIRFRNYALDGVISFRRGFIFSCYTFFYASLIFAVVQYVYFQYFDHGAMMTLLLQAMKMLERTYQNNKDMLEPLRQTEELMGQMTPIEISFIFMMQNLLWGFIFSLPIAFFGRVIGSGQSNIK
jgi:uncharacterized membrane protein YhdT